MKKLRGLLIPAVCMIAVWILFRTLFFIGYVPTSSMEPTLPEGSIILGLRVYGKPQTGDIVVFEHEGRLLVKRIAASPGETVDVHGEEVTVPENNYYMLGDNTENSYDSRFWQNPFIAGESIAAKLIGQ